LNTADKTVGATVAQSISAVAQAELTRDMWPELIPALLHNATAPDSPSHTKQNTLEAIGFICEEIVCRRTCRCSLYGTGGAHSLLPYLQDPNILANYSNQILTAIINGMRQEEPKYVRMQSSCCCFALHGLPNCIGGN
jgi:importin subunit beta-1